MDNLVLKSKLGYWFLHKIIAVYILFTFLSICTCINEPIKSGGDYSFNFDNLPYLQIWLIVILSIFLFIQFLSKKEITIDKFKNTVVIKNYSSKRKRSYSLNQITNMSWENKNTTINHKYGKHSGNEKNFSISFNDGHVLEVKGSEYINFFELQSFFLTYCNNHNIIQIVPLAERKKSRFRRKKNS